MNRVWKTGKSGTNGRAKEIVFSDPTQQFLSWNTMGYLCFVLVGIACFMPLEAFAAVTLETQLDVVNTLAMEKLKPTAIALSSAGIGIWGVIKGSPKLIGVAIMIGVVLSLYLSWVEDGMKFGG